MKTVKKIINLIQKFSDSITEANIAAFSGESTLFIIISFFPFIMLMLMIIKYTPLTEASLISMIKNIVPFRAADTVESVINNIYSVSSSAAISVSVITLIWSASRGFMSLVRGFNSVYRVKESRGYIRLRISAIFYTICLALLIVFTLTLLVFGNKILSFLTYHFPEINNLAVLIISVRTVVSMALYLLFFVLLYLILPNRKSSILYELPGATLSSFGWLAFSYIYSYYINTFNTSLSMYGSLSTIVLLMVWLYFCIYILFIGAVINQKIRMFISNIIDNRKAQKDSPHKNNE